MLDRERTIELLRIAAEHAGSDYGWRPVRRDAIDAAIAMLEEEEPISFEVLYMDPFNGPKLCCPKCNAIWMYDPKETHYCPDCGRKIKYDVSKIKDVNGNDDWRCGNCGYWLHKTYRVCPHCGRKVMR